MNADNHQRKFLIDGSTIAPSAISQAAKAQAPVEISGSPDFGRHLEQSRAVLNHALENGLAVYGVTTGFGKCCGKRMIAEVAELNGTNLIRFHGCGLGAPLDVEDVRAAMICRLLCFARGYSGVTMALMEKIAAFLNAGITPVVPCEGSVGASGDLTPMSYVAAALMGEREVFYKGSRMAAGAALQAAGIEPYDFGPKEPLAMMNGTAIMTGIAVMVLERGRRILNAAICATALTIHAIHGNAHHYHPAISAAKPHPGQNEAAARIAELLTGKAPDTAFSSDQPETLQDPYCVRCSPQVLGVLADTDTWARQWVTTEANSANDNPLFDPESGDVLMGGNFYGGHIALAMDALKAALASVADMADRQVALMVDANVNRGLPQDLVGVDTADKPFHHGFKAMSISTSALAAEALKETMPAASFSRSTESHNQDKVSMGSIAARDARRVCELVEKTLGIHLLTAVQGCELRGSVEKRPCLERLVGGIRAIAPATIEDRPMDTDISRMTEAISASELFAPDFSPVAR